ncbi:hypothetical protein ASPZODRAFT_74805 [Penicilliopsis zonata CBS 506.65]|uniref:PXA domain-containing protein n=1 Tax=Penicilliopsis zonata CBS 506.65 TaxID=1073090 RepID=A0A1L9S852_9EURO|nr:hypothetical protein ASPZODRAFT_74805 [Penicilliopsis zonata CBS 506.65]OJJ43320.1 hypothetical protein ASPZODRAFT_74805 [Penicilliopsis zonata CBS 506.65]
MEDCNTDLASNSESQGTGTSNIDAGPTGPSVDSQKDSQGSYSQPKTLIDAALEFLAVASNESLISAFVVLLAIIYIVFGQLGLLLIGVCLGVVFHASWEGSYHQTENNAPLSRNVNRRKELALELAGRLLEIPVSNSRRLSIQDGETKGSEIPLELDHEYPTFRPETAAALQSLTHAILANYVKYWYDPILPSEPKFALSCQKTLSDFIVSVSGHLSQKRTADTFTQFITNSSSMMIVFLNELSAAYQSSGNQQLSPEQVVKQYLEVSPDCSLANVLSRKQQQKKFNMLAEDILSTFLDKKAYECDVMRTFLREVLSGIVLESMVSNLSRPETINSWILYLLRDGEPEIMSAIDAGIEGSKTQNADLAESRTATGHSTLNTTGDDGNPTQAVSTIAREGSILQNQETAIASLIDKHLSIDTPTHDGRQIQPTISNNIDDSTNLLHQETYSAAELHQLEQNNGQLATGLVELTTEQRQPRPSPAERRSIETTEAPQLSLHGAWVSVDDGSSAGERDTLRSKPTSDYFLQIEPSSSRFPGWMIFRKYADFESLHETIEAIARLNDVRGFREKHTMLPAWKGQTKKMLARSLEQYLQDALRHEILAESPRMKRFLEKDGSFGIDPSPEPTAKLGFSFRSQTALENVGKGVLGALTQAPKGVAGSGKAVLDGVTNVFGTVAGTSKRFSNIPAENGSLMRNISVNTKSDGSHATQDTNASRSEPKLAGPNTSNSHVMSPTMEGTQSPPQGTSMESFFKNSPSSAEGVGSFPALATPELTDASSESHAARDEKIHAENNEHTQNSMDQEGHALGLLKSPVKSSMRNPLPGDVDTSCGPSNSPITCEETQMAVELIFAVINELYTLSSAWNIRRTFLNAAKSYILRPSSPHLENIRALLQESMIEAHTSDEAIGSYISKMRENVLPTDQEQALWPSPPDEAEKQRLRETARKVFIQKGIPQALTSIMGAAASREALEKVFDCLQVDLVARGFVFALLLQAMKAIML